MRSFSSWDVNHDGFLDSTELNGTFGQGRLYQRYDMNGDGIIDSSEATRIPSVQRIR